MAFWRGDRGIPPTRPVKAATNPVFPHCGGASQDAECIAQGVFFRKTRMNCTFFSSSTLLISNRMKQKHQPRQKIFCPVAGSSDPTVV